MKRLLIYFTWKHFTVEEWLPNTWLASKSWLLLGNLVFCTFWTFFLCEPFMYVSEQITFNHNISIYMILIFHSFSVKNNEIGEWRGLMVSVEDCHSKGQRFKSQSFLFFRSPIAMLYVAKSFWMKTPCEKRTWKRGSQRERGRTGRRIRNGYKKWFTSFRKRLNG